MFPIMDCLVTGGVSALTLGSYLVRELFTSPLASMADTASQSRYSSPLSPEVGPDSQYSALGRHFQLTGISP